MKNIYKVVKSSYGSIQIRFKNFFRSRSVKKNEMLSLKSGTYIAFIMFCIAEKLINFDFALSL